MLGFRPIFIVGAQRSGTTFLAERLGRFDGVMTTPEAQVMKRLLALGTTPLLAQKAKDVTALVRQDFRFWTLGIDCCDTQMDQALRAGGGFALARDLLETYRDQRGQTGAKIWVEHSPENLLDLPWLMAALPDAKVIHIVRDGRGVLGSFRGLDWGPHSARRVADYWLATTMTGAAMSAQSPDRVMTLRYEDLVNDEARELARIAAFADLGDLPAHDGAASFVLPDFTKDQHSLVGGDPVAARKDAWQQILSPRDIEIFTHFAGVGLHYFGYIDDTTPEPFEYGARDAARDYLADGWKLLGSRFRRSWTQRRFVRQHQTAAMR